ncbi:MAG TPA: hypothetical protein VL988_06910 [Solirubrobacteraceae bacterium]|nr:hypothetical protein [Solirubrobacteraceae bacterium]
MSSDASTLPLRDAPVASPQRRRGLLRGRARPLAANAGERTWPAVACLAVSVLCSLAVVLMAANRPSVLSATSHPNYFPHWMTGPLGGLLPWFARNSITLKYVFSGAIVAMYASYLLGLRYVPRIRPRWAIAAVVAVHAIFFLSPPLALTDVFNYVNYGRMDVVHHLNPYTTIPILEPHNDPSYDLSNWHQLLSPYGPLFTILTFAVVPLGVAASFWVLKGVLALASLGTLLLVWKCARLLGRDPVKAILIVGLNPIVLVWGLGGDHNDFVMVFLVVLCFYLLLLVRARAQAQQEAGEGRSWRWPVWPVAPAAARSHLREWLLPLSWLEIGAGAAVVAAAGVKASGAVLVPVVLAAALPNPRRFTQVLLGMGVCAAAIAVVSVATFGLHTPDLTTQSKLVTSVSVPNLIGLALAQGGETEVLHKLLSLALVVSVVLCCVQAYKRRSPITASGWSSIALLATLSWVLPWYVLWVLPMAALTGSVRLRRTALAWGVYLVIAWAPASGQLWQAIHFHPEKTSLGRLHQRYVKELLN